MSVATSLEYSYRYRHLSQLEPARQRLRLATFTPVDGSHPYFFVGELQQPRRAADLLRALFQVVQSRFHVPAAMLGRILAQADPVVTCHQDTLRWEGFSACCGAYARLDWLPDALRGQTLGRGTTNIDFNAPLLAALAAVHQSDRLSVSVGSQQVEVTRNEDSVIEKRVALPLRWLKGFVEVQACLSRMLLRHEIPGLDASRFLRSLPRMKTNRRETFVIASGRSLRISQVAQSQAVRVGGLERLRVLEPLAADALQLRVYGDDLTGASVWELEFDDSRFQLAISPEVWRGFSGEGQVLDSLATSPWDDTLPLVKAQLKWQTSLRPEDLAARFRTSEEAVRGALAVLGSQGLVGYDVRTASYFPRELPFDFSKVEKLHPRLKDARQLVAERCVARAATAPGKPLEFWIRSRGIEHRVMLSADHAACTCPWFSKHGTARGPCKHILAAQIFTEEPDGE